jgi:hypothetical protein
MKITKTISQVGDYEIIIYKNELDQYHREDGPAKEWVGGGYNGHKIWFFNGKEHRLDGPAVIWYDGKLAWYKNGEVHRIQGPALNDSAVKEWWKNNRRHRLNAPAIVYSSGNAGKYFYFGINDARNI